jgi:hypothetical protein
MSIGHSSQLDRDERSTAPGRMLSGTEGNGQRIRLTK